MKHAIHVAFLLSATCSSCASMPRWNTDDPEGIRYLDTVAGGLKCRTSVRVVDESGTPMANFPIKVAFEQLNGSFDTVSGTTDCCGVFTAEGHSVDKVIARSDDANYYRSFNELEFYHYKDFSNIDGDRWLPWNSTNTIVVRPKRNPVPMISQFDFSQDVLPEIPLDEPIGFDCKRFAYLPPYGTGEVADFTVEIKSTSDGTNELRLAAIDDGGGIHRPSRRNAGKPICDGLRGSDQWICRRIRTPRTMDSRRGARRCPEQRMALPQMVHPGKRTIPRFPVSGLQRR